MPCKGKSSKNKWKQHKRPKTAMMKKFRRGKERRQARWMIGRIGIRKARETPKEFET